MLRIEDLQVETRQEEDWANAWKEFYQVHRLGKRTVIKPPWQAYEPEPDDIIIEIDPGMAFGTGLHPTTRLCLLFLEDILPPLAHENIKAVDVGTGSGILAIAAAKLGAGLVVGVDTDQVAVQAAAENVARNNLSDKIILARGSLAVELGGTANGGFYSFPEEDQQTPPELAQHLPFRLVIANIIARVLIFLAPHFAGALEQGGMLVSSGIISEKADEVTAAFEAAGLKVEERRQEGDWVALLAKKL
jgi:ribosomal protein L11 methyltransferase